MSTTYDAPTNHHMFPFITTRPVKLHSRSISLDTPGTAYTQASCCPLPLPPPPLPSIFSGRSPWAIPSVSLFAAYLHICIHMLRCTQNCDNPVQLASFSYVFFYPVMFSRNEAIVRSLATLPRPVRGRQQRPLDELQLQGQLVVRLGLDQRAFLLDL